MLFFYYYSFVVQFLIGDDDISRSSLIIQECFIYPGIFFLVFLYEA